MARRNDPAKINLGINDIKVFKNEYFEGICIDWASDIGFGEYNIYRKPGGSEWFGESECMDSNQDKAFLQELLRLLLDNVKIEG